MADRIEIEVVREPDSYGQWLVQIHRGNHVMTVSDSDNEADALAWANDLADVLGAVVNPDKSMRELVETPCCCCHLHARNNEPCPDCLRHDDPEHHLHRTS